MKLSDFPDMLKKANKLFLQWGKYVIVLYSARRSRLRSRQFDAARIQTGGDCCKAACTIRYRRIHASSSNHAQQTAMPLAEFTHIPIQTLDWCNENYVGQEFFTNNEKGNGVGCFRTIKRGSCLKVGKFCCSDKSGTSTPHSPRSVIRTAWSAWGGKRMRFWNRSDTNTTKKNVSIMPFRPIKSGLLCLRTKVSVWRFWALFSIFPIRFFARISVWRIAEWVSFVFRARGKWLRVCCSFPTIRISTERVCLPVITGKSFLEFCIY